MVKRTFDDLNALHLGEYDTKLHIILGKRDFNMQFLGTCEVWGRFKLGRNEHHKGEQYARLLESSGCRFTMRKPLLTADVFDYISLKLIFMFFFD